MLNPELLLNRCEEVEGDREDVKEEHHLEEQF